MNKIICLLLLLIFCSGLNAQDVIYVNPRIAGRPAPPGANRMTPRPGKEGRPLRITYPATATITGKVTEISPAYISYRVDGDPQNNIYSTPINNIDSVVFASGRVQTFFKTKERPMPPHKVRERAEFANLGTNIISASFGVFTHRVRFLTFNNQEDEDFTPFIKTGFSYEKVLLNDRVGIEVAPFVALNKKGYGGVLHAKFYPKNYGRFRIGLGPFYTLYVRDKTDRYYSNTDGYSMQVTYQTTMSVLGFGVQLQSHIDRNWLVNFNAGIGGVVGYSNRSQNIPGMSFGSETGMGQGELRLGLGYRF